MARPHGAVGSFQVTGKAGAVTQAAGLGIIIVLLLLKPQGLFGREVE